MKSKWEWIEEKLRELGYSDLADMAKEIEQHLKEIYGNTVTEEWSRNYKLVNISYDEWSTDRGRLLDICRVSDDRTYCVACDRARRKVGSWFCCNACEYGELYGRCSDKESEYDRFNMALRAKLSGD